MRETMATDESDTGKGRILVAVGSSPNSARLIRWARRSAAASGSPWIAAHVDSGRELGLADEERLEANLSLARRLGAEIRIVQAPDVARAVVGAARSLGATMIVIGRSGLSRLGPFPKRATVSDRIVREAGDIDVAVIQDTLAPRRDVTLAEIGRLFKAPLRQYALLAACFAAVSGLGWLIVPFVGYRSVAMLFLAAVLGLSFLAKPAPVAAFAVLSALALNYFFITPYYTLSISAPEDLFLFAAYFVVAFATGTLVAKLRTEERKLVERERTSAFLLGSVRRLTERRSLADAAREAAAVLGEHFGGRAAVFVPLAGGGLQELSGTADGPAGRAVGEEDRSVGEADRLAAERALVGGDICGRGTESFPEARMRHFPASAGDGAVVALAVEPPAGRRWSRNDDGLVLALGRTLALVVERERSEAESRKAALELESERLSKVLLDSVSHELRTPLTTITGSVSALKDEGLAGRPESRRALVEGALEAADRLNRLVEDILSASRIGSTGLRLNRSLVDLSDLAGESLRAAGPELGGREVRTVLPAACRPARLDLGLAARLAGNLLRNAARYSPPGSPIELRVEEEGRDLAIAVRDSGPGVAEEELEAIFERFGRGRKAAGGGLGLGLAICRGIAAAHGGSIGARNVPEGGLEVRAVFPDCVEEEAP